jgi:hypothetical protein
VAGRSSPTVPPTPPAVRRVTDLTVDDVLAGNWQPGGDVDDD